MNPTSNEANQKQVTLKDDPDRNKKCPHCNVNFFYTKSIDIDIAHTHSELWMPVNSDISGINTEHMEPITPTTDAPVDDTDNCDVNNINIETVVKGNNHEDVASVNGSNTANLKSNSVIGINNDTNRSSRSLLT